MAKNGAIRVHNYWAAADAGLAVNPAAFSAQVESAVVWGLSCCLKERVTMAKGQVQQSNFHEYQIMRMAEVQAGLGFGVKKFRLVWVFQTQQAFDSFVRRGYQIGGHASAA